MLNINGINLSDRLRELLTITPECDVQKGQAGHKTKDQDSNQHSHKRYPSDEPGIGEHVDRYA